MEHNHVDYETARKHAARFRITGAVVLALGLLGASLICWRGSRSPDFSEDPSLVGFRRAQTRQMGVLFGKSGQMSDDLIESLKRPGVQAGLIAGVCGLIALSCFFLGRGPARDGGDSNRERASHANS